MANVERDHSHVCAALKQENQAEAKAKDSAKASGNTVPATATWLCTAVAAATATAVAAAITIGASPGDDVGDGKDEIEDEAEDLDERAAASDEYKTEDVLSPLLRRRESSEGRKGLYMFTCHGLTFTCYADQIHLKQKTAQSASFTPCCAECSEHCARH
jgi:7-cyano-7-deazaguanine synthase in queuosine biosynthesis